MNVLKNLLSLLFSGRRYPGSVHIEEIEKMDFNRRYHHLGKFIYEEDGFIFQFDKGIKKIKWNDIESLIAYKTDLMTVDEICIDITYNDRQFTITEETQGWYQFGEKIKTVFKNIPKDWDIDIVQPPFVRNQIVLYQRRRSQ